MNYLTTHDRLNLEITNKKIVDGSSVEEGKEPWYIYIFIYVNYYF